MKPDPSLPYGTPVNVDFPEDYPYRDMTDVILYPMDRDKLNPNWTRILCTLPGDKGTGKRTAGYVRWDLITLKEEPMKPNFDLPIGTEVVLVDGENTSVARLFLSLKEYPNARLRIAEYDPDDHSLPVRIESIMDVEHNGSEWTGRVGSAWVKWNYIEVAKEKVVPVSPTVGDLRIAEHKSGLAGEIRFEITSALLDTIVTPLLNEPHYIKIHYVISHNVTTVTLVIDPYEATYKDTLEYRIFTGVAICNAKDKHNTATGVRVALANALQVADPNAWFDCDSTRRNIQKEMWRFCRIALNRITEGLGYSLVVDAPKKESND